MIQQPELGKKVLELRKSKGITQEELVEKCNLSVRTLQRIESGEVTPRPITVKLIFEALEESFDKAMENKGLTQKWLEQFYISLIDLFNLKTNTMKKISILTLITSAIVIGVFSITNETKAQDNLKSANDKKLANESIVDTSMWYSYLHSKESFYDNNVLIARDIKFTSHGVTIASTLIKVNQDTREFITTFASGKLSIDKVEIFISKENLKKVKYSAEKIDKKYRLINLVGNAKVIVDENRFIESKEIIITTD